MEERVATLESELEELRQGTRVVVRGTKEAVDCAEGLAMAYNDHTHYANDVEEDTGGTNDEYFGC